MDPSLAGSNATDPENDGPFNRGPFVVVLGMWLLFVPQTVVTIGFLFRMFSTLADPYQIWGTVRFLAVTGAGSARWTHKTARRLTPPARPGACVRPVKRRWTVHQGRSVLRHLPVPHISHSNATM